MSADKTPRRLGRGLDALLGEKTTQRPRSVPRAPADTEPQAAEARSAFREIPIGDIKPNHYQPRKEFSQQELAELADSIRTAGLLQPIAVRTVQGGYELVAGERRLRAIKTLGWTAVPAIVKDYDDRTMLTMALIWPVATGGSRSAASALASSRVRASARRRRFSHSGSIYPWLK